MKGERKVEQSKVQENPSYSNWKYEQWCFRGRKGSNGGTKVEQEGDSCQARGKMKRPGEQTEIENVDRPDCEEARLFREKLSTHSIGKCPNERAKRS